MPTDARHGDGLDASTYASRPGSWVCIMCKHPSNKSHVPRCEICGYKAPRTKLGMKVNGRFVLMKVKPARPPDNLQSLRMYDLTNDSWHDDVPILDPSEEDLELRIRTTVISTLGHTIHRPWSVAAPLTEWGIMDDLSSDDIKGGNVTDDEFSDDSASNSRGASRAGNSKGQESLSLFDRVMNDAATQAYDPQIGQYVKKRRAQRALLQAERESQQATLASELTGDTDGTDFTPNITFHGLETEFGYVKRMKNERSVMTFNVAKRNKAAREARLKGENVGAVQNNQAISTVPRHTFKPCTLCQQEFPPKALKGLVPLNAVVKWREDHGDPVDADDPKWRQRLDPSKRYEPCKLCIFCMQFFDKNFVEYISYHKGTTNFKDRALDLEGDRSNSGLDDTVTKVLERKRIGERVPLSEEQIAPVLQDMAFLHLKTMSEKPKLMETVGCQLAKYSNPSNRLKLTHTLYTNDNKRRAGAPRIKKSGSTMRSEQAAGISGVSDSSMLSATLPAPSTISPKKRKIKKKQASEEEIESNRGSAALNKVQYQHRYSGGGRRERADRFVNQSMTRSTDFLNDEAFMENTRFPPIHQHHRRLSGQSNLEDEWSSNGTQKNEERRRGRKQKGSRRKHNPMAQHSFSEEIDNVVSNGAWKKFSSSGKSRNERALAL